MQIMKMKKACLFASTVFLLVSCGKDKFNTVPEIKFTSITPNVISNSSFPGQIDLTFKLKDAEGDFGVGGNNDSTYVYVKNITTSQELDSFRFPLLNGISRKNMDVEVTANILRDAKPSNIPAPYTDTLYFEIYVRDNAGHKSNVEQAGPLYYIRN